MKNNENFPFSKSFAVKFNRDARRRIISSDRLRDIFAGRWGRRRHVGDGLEGVGQDESVRGRAHRLGFGGEDNSDGRRRRKFLANIRFNSKPVALYARRRCLHVRHCDGGGKHDSRFEWIYKLLLPRLFGLAEHLNGRSRRRVKILARRFRLDAERAICGCENLSVSRNTLRVQRQQRQKHRARSYFQKNAGNTKQHQRKSGGTNNPGCEVITTTPLPDAGRLRLQRRPSRTRIWFPRRLLPTSAQGGGQGSNRAIFFGALRHLILRRTRFSMDETAAAIDATVLPFAQRQCHRRTCALLYFVVGARIESDTPRREWVAEANDRNGAPSRGQKSVTFKPSANANALQWKLAYVVAVDSFINTSAHVKPNSCR